jgi:hypothetical protein
MACPFFVPQRRLDPGAWTHLPRLPLGDSYFGFCQTSFKVIPAEEHQRELCNRGYARGLCAHFPGSSAADAVRFSVTDGRDGCMRVVYVFEKDHAPLSHGVLDFPAAQSAAPVDELLLRQARAFVESYLKSVEDSKIPAQ